MARDAVNNAAESDAPRSKSRYLIAAFLSLAGLAWLLAAALQAQPYAPTAQPAPAASLQPGTVASMDSPALSYSDGWHISELGADPSEPADAWVQPSGILTVPYTGGEFALNLTLGAYWAYVYVTVDGEPANRLSNIRGNNDSTGASAGYRTFYAPDQQVDEAPQARWVTVHSDRDPAATHEARIEVWRGWGQTPLRGVAIDALPRQSIPAWPGVAVMLLGIALLTQGLLADAGRLDGVPGWTYPGHHLAWLLLPGLSSQFRLLLAGIALAIIAAGVLTPSWLLSAVGLGGLALLSLARPALWTAALLFCLPFYFAYTVPILPNRDLGLVDTFVLLGIVVAAANWLLMGPSPSSKSTHLRPAHVLALLLAFLVAWALVSTAAADHLDVALREWRTVFLYAGLFAILLAASLSCPSTRHGDLWLIIAAWIAGATLVSFIGLLQYASGTMLISAEGVQRIRAFYGSPNNLALYLERTFLVTLALAAFLPAGRTRLVVAAVAGVQAVALALTFSKGALLLGVPAGLLILWLGGMILLPLEGRTRRPLLWLAGGAGIIALAVLPFLGTERFSGLFDFSQGTGYLRLLLWRSSLRMGLDHPLLGVGPDNFLYAYRSVYILPEAWQEPNLNHPHNWILDWWTRIGLPGLFAAAFFFAIGLAGRWRGARSLAKIDPAAAALALGLGAAGVAALAHGLIDASFALPDLMLVWVLILMAPIGVAAPIKPPERKAQRSGSNRRP